MSNFTWAALEAKDSFDKTYWANEAYALEASIKSLIHLEYNQNIDLTKYSTHKFFII